MISWLATHLLLAGSLLGIGAIGVGAIVYAPLGLLLLNAAKTAVQAMDRFLSALNPQGWIGLIGCTILTIALVHSSIDARHWKKQAAQTEKLYQNEIENEKKLGAQAVDLKTKLDALSSSVTEKLVELHDAENARIAADAAALRVSGPGKATCGDSAVISAGASALKQPGRNGNASGSQMPTDDRAAVPWNWLVTRAEEHDQWRSEALTWRQWYAAIEKEWPKSEGTAK